MLEDSAIIKVKNRFDGTSSYTIPDERIQRTFASGEVKDITMKELRSLSYQPGGKELMAEYLCIMNADAAQELIGRVEPEYNYTEEDVKRIMLTGSIDEFLDMLDFAPAGVIDIVKTMAVQCELNDVRKREAIYDKTGFNVTRALENLRLEKEAAEAEGTTEQSSSGRRVQVKKETPKTESTPARRVYNVVG